MKGMLKHLIEGLAAVKDAVLGLAPGLKNVGQDVSAEMSRMGTQGSMELASALFNGNAFVPYGPGQYTPTPDHEHGHEHSMEHER